MIRQFIGLRSAGKDLRLRTPIDDRRSRYYDEISQEDSSDDGNEIILPTGEGIIFFLNNKFGSMHFAVFCKPAIY